MIREPMKTWVRTGLLLAVVDGAFSGVLSAFFYGSTAAKLFQGVASTVLGPSALTGGTRTALIGLAMHVGVAFGWSAVFLMLAMRSAWLQRIIATPAGVFAVAAVYGPCIWLVMSLIVIPTLLHRPPTFNIRWFIQFFGHIPFVGLPIVWSVARSVDREREIEAQPALAIT